MSQDMRNFGSKGIAIAKRQMALRGKQSGGKKVDDSRERIEYLESQLAKKRGYVSYDKHKEIERNHELEKKRKADSVDWMTPFIIMVAIAGGIGALLYFGGFLTP
jgi:hypothetical protein